MATRWLAVLGAFSLSLVSAAAAPDAARYCADLQRIVQLSAARDGFGPITGKAREGNFHDTSLRLAGWHDCAIYAQQSYACNSEPIASGAAAQSRVADAVAQVKACFTDGAWSEDPERTSSSYVALRSSAGRASITISTDEEAGDRHFVRFLLFLRP